MHTGTLINELIAAVERVEEQAQKQAKEPASWKADIALEQAGVEQNLLGVA
jgi:hypothetical protein